MTLDCENFESTLNCVSEIFHHDRSKILALLRSIDLENIYESQTPAHPPDEFLYRAIVAKFGPPKPLNQVCLFHLTSVAPNTTFDGGILPLGESIEILWDTLLKIFIGTKIHKNLTDLRSQGVKDHLYSLKTPDPFHWGPFAMLVRESAFNPEELGNHDYLRCPEIIEDICNGYEKRYSESIYERVVKNLHPCIVKFRSKKWIDMDLIKVAIYYLHMAVNNSEWDHSANTCFDGKGESVPKSDIIKVEFLPHLANGRA